MSCHGVLCGHPCCDLFVTWYSAVQRYVKVRYSLYLVGPGRVNPKHHTASQELARLCDDKVGAWGRRLLSSGFRQLSIILQILRS